MQSKIKSLSNIYLSGLASIVCVKTAKKHAVWFRYSYPKIPEVKFLRNFRNLTTDDTTRLCRNQRDALAKNLRKLRRVWSIACDIAREGEKLRFSPQAISRHLALRRDSAIRHRSHWLPRQFERLLRGAECDNDHAFDAQEVSLPSREARVFWQVLRTIHLAAPQRDNCSTHQRRVVGRASHTRRPIAVARARPLSPPTAHQKLFLATICPIPALESTSGMVPPSSNHPRRRNVSRRHVCARDAFRLRRARNAATR